jgi:hypothetical protein
MDLLLIIPILSICVVNAYFISASLSGDAHVKNQFDISTIFEIETKKGNGDRLK